MSEIKPALTPEQWASATKYALVGRAADHVLAESGPHSWLEPHEVAALALHGQPFGFTWEDVDALELVYRRVLRVPEPLGEDGAAAVERLHSHVARLASLLPPRDP